jgi:hypothetical protein
MVLVAACALVQRAALTLTTHRTLPDNAAWFVDGAVAFAGRVDYCPDR